MPRDPFDYMTARAAAEHCGVSEACIRKWVQRGTLKPAGRGKRSQMLFRFADVARAEGRTAERAGRAA
jgi:DNA-binding transcriptional MerR regulator